MVFLFLSSFYYNAQASFDRFKQCRIVVVMMTNDITANNHTGCQCFESDQIILDLFASFQFSFDLHASDASPARALPPSVWLLDVRAVAGKEASRSKGVFCDDE